MYMLIHILTLKAKYSTQTNYYISLCKVYHWKKGAFLDFFHTSYATSCEWKEYLRKLPYSYFLVALIVALAAVFIGDIYFLFIVFTDTCLAHQLLWALLSWPQSVDTHYKFMYLTKKKKKKMDKMCKATADFSCMCISIGT